METKIYRVAPEWKTMIVRGLVAGIFLALFTTYSALFAPPRDKSQLVPMYGVLITAYCGVVFCIRLLTSCNTSLEVTDKQIIQHAPGKPPFALDWDDVTHIKNNVSMQRLELHHSSKGRIIVVEHQTQDFDELREFIARKTGHMVT